MIVISLLFLSTSVFASADFGKVVDLKGAAQVTTSAGQKEDLKLGSLVQAGDRVRTEKNSTLRLVFESGVAVQVVANSEFEIESSALKDGRGLSLNLLLGGIHSAVKKLRSTGYQIRTKDAVMGVRGTVFYVGAPDAKKNKRTFLCPCNGKVVVSGKGKSEVVFVGVHHDEPSTIGSNTKGELAVTKAKVVDPHTDADAEELMKLLEK